MVEKFKNKKWFLLRKVMCVAMLVSIVLGSLDSNRVIVVYAGQEENTSYEIAMSSAKKVAEMHINEVVSRGEQTGKWKKTTRIGKGIVLRDSEEEVCAYAFQLKNEANDAGYIVVGANTEQPPVIEYVTDGSFLSGKLGEEEYIIYDGGLNYYKATDDSDTLINIHDENEERSKDDIAEDEASSYISEWENFGDAIEFQSGEATPPQSGGEITNPNEYETGYKKMTYKDVPSATYVHYFTTNSFPGYNKHCVPTAVTNILYYWHERKFWYLMNGSWSNTFAQLHSYLGTNPTTGTVFSKVPEALNKYLRGINMNNGNIRIYDNPEWWLMKEEIDGGAPFLYNICEHYLYGNHCVLALGYMEFEYASKQFYTDSKYSRYLKVADGWTKTADRYIHVNVGSKQNLSSIVTLYFIGK